MTVLTRVPRARQPLPIRCAGIGAVGAGVPGAIVGLVVGLVGYPPTAVFAMFELGVPTALLGILLGLLVGLTVRVVRSVGRARIEHRARS